MKLIILMMTLTFCFLRTSGQNKESQPFFNKLTDVSGTPYVVASMENRVKSHEPAGNYLVFINTKSGESTQVDFPKGAALSKIEQVRIDSLGINLLILTARTIDLDGKKGIDWDDPVQVIALSADGMKKTQLTDNNYFARIWTVNRHTGAIAITGYADSNRNNRFDQTDRGEICIFDLKTMKKTGEFMLVKP